MDRERTPQQAHLVTARLRTQGVLTLGALTLAAVPLVGHAPWRGLLVGLYLGGAWMFISVAGIVWVMRDALEGRAARAWQPALLLVGMTGPLAVGALAVWWARPSPAGLTLGVTIGLGMFAMRCRQLMGIRDAR